MKKKKVIKLISFAIFFLLIFQLIPSTLTCIDGFQNHTQNSNVFLSSGAFHTDVIYIGSKSQKSSIQKVQLKNTLIFVPQISIEDISVINFSFQKLPLDYRRVIRQSIPHYFNGSKYKNNCFAI